ncbi:hypothetical protein KHC33_03830 [Methanospirillum sp. J.3.6.1-F.2.7.3]|uniref:Uncharacterized protein n=1 Tax=Methanospirillum purgamenti TaxID=2834276 RepID=A0A8E7AYB7_9EURY|nr:hypothetical protein [Methanospirillum sp. J.3.6.1-F.2.7.3]MDX8551977.1 hypothetical protein [Methanospirillum hungatei]QVV89660.1 hypothetical protein KHC33_03830 [Methanospirillum sp. J.3.6.1-F.2.7.3]
MDKHDFLLASIASIFPGWGHIYLGNYLKGIFLFIFFVGIGNIPVIFKSIPTALIPANT